MAGYEGKIKNQGAQVVKGNASSKKGSGTVKTGSDLRTGK